MHKKLSLLLVPLILILATDIGAYTLGDFMSDLVQPGRRRGLVARMDAGGGASFIGVDLTSGNISETEGAVAMTGGFGYTPTDQFMLTVSGLPPESATNSPAIFMSNLSTFTARPMKTTPPARRIGRAILSGWSLACWGPRLIETVNAAYVRSWTEGL